MTEEERGELITNLIENPAKRDRERILRDADLTAVERADVESLVDVADLVWLAGQKPPPLEDDPVAIRLGIVPPVQSDECRAYVAPIEPVHLPGDEM